MSEEIFYKTFWATYLQIENELIAVFKYIELSTDNYKTYSSKLLKIYLQIGSEIDVCFKKYCNELSVNDCDNMNDYKVFLDNNDVDFFDEEIIVDNRNIILKPWYELKNNNLIWWKAYNKVKHERDNEVTIGGITQLAYKFANLENILNSLGGLYILLMNLFSKIKGNREESPVPNSKIFHMKSSRWEECKNFTAIYASTGKDEGLYLQSPKDYLFW